MAKPPALALARMTIRLLLLATGIVAGFAVVLWSPVLLLLVLGNELPWASLSDVGQAYGGASALLSAAALSGVAVSLVLQARQMRQQLITTDRQSHSELVMLGLKDPTLFAALDPVGVNTDEDLKKVYANQWMVYWLGLWEVNDLPERELRNHLSRMFRSPTSLAWWGDRQGNHATAGSGTSWQWSQTSGGKPRTETRLGTPSRRRTSFFRSRSPKVRPESSAQRCPSPLPAP